MAAPPRAPKPHSSGTLTGKELPGLVGVAEVRGALQHPEVRPRGVGELDEHVGHVEHLQQGRRGCQAPLPVLAVGSHCR